ncbi:cytochrome b [Sphingomonas sp.]
MGAAIAPTRRYDRVAMAFHWTIAALILLNIALAWKPEALTLPFAAMPAHKALGITILLLGVARLGWRLVHRPPPLAPTLTAPVRALARASHALFYVLMIGLPLAGWIMVSGAEVRRPLDWFGLFDIPYLPVSRSAGDVAHKLHETGAFLLAALIALHVAAALRHQFVLRDGTMARMLPGAPFRA